MSVFPRVVDAGVNASELERYIKRTSSASLLCLHCSRLVILDEMEAIFLHVGPY